VSARRIAEVILKYRIAVVAVVLVLTAFLGTRLGTLRFGADINADLPADDPEVAYFLEFQEHFGNAELLIVALHGDIFSRQGLTYLRRLTEELAEIDGVTEAVSLASVSDLRLVGREMEAGPFLSSIPESARGLSLLKQDALSNPQWARSLVSEDGSVVAINLLLETGSDLQVTRIRIADRVQQILDETPALGIETYVTGVSSLMRDLRTYVQRDFRRLLWATPLLIIILLLLMLRGWRGVLIPLTVIGMSVTWTLGLLVLLGREVSVTMVMVPTLIAVISLSDVIHILAHYREHAAAGAARREAILLTMDHMLGACFLTSLTTAIGFGSLAFSRQQTVHEVGIVSATGIMISYIVAVTVVPVVLSWLRLPRVGRARAHPPVLSRLLNGLAGFIDRNHRAIPVVTAIILAGCAVGIAQLKVETQMSDYLPADAPSVRGLEFLRGKMAGFGTLEMGVEGPPGCFKSAAAVRELEKIQRHLESFTEIDRSFSLADLVKTVHVSRNEGAEPIVPAAPGVVEEYLLLLSMSERSDMLTSLVTEDYDLARVAARGDTMSTARQLEILESVEMFAVENLPDELLLQTTGLPKLYAARVGALVTGQMLSLGITFVVISCLLVVYLRSLGLGLISMIPNILPVAMTLAVMGLAGISLNVSTLMISCIAIAIAVDDTIHFLVRYRREKREGADGAESIRRTLQKAGRAMVFTSVVIAGGFSILALSHFQPNRHFGLLTAVTMLSALAADLVVLPALIRVFRLK